MRKLKITIGERNIVMGDIETCTKRTSLDDKKIDYAFSSSEGNNYNYFDITFIGKPDVKILAVDGDVELIETPTQENRIKKWDKK